MNCVGRLKVENKKTETAIDVLGRMYLSEFLTLGRDGDYGRNEAVFNFNPNEPPVALYQLGYLTPRGLHICLSQAAYCFYEHLVRKERLPFDIDIARDLYFDMRLRITELNQKFRREMPLRHFQGKLSLDRMRIGKEISLAKISFDMSNRAITGDLTTVISPYSVPPTNADILRN
ncbi:MAG: hypothetical protein KKF50_01725 [Nanoarchaeota archaeon]|nr:hypothetical protein [Nanoarchaeota archaeon]